jgi:hypothetical protein
VPVAGLKPGPRPRGRQVLISHEPGYIATSDPARRSW